MIHDPGGAALRRGDAWDDQRRLCRTAAYLRGDAALVPALSVVAAPATSAGLPLLRMVMR